FFMLLIRSDFGNPVLFHHQWRTAHALASLAMLWLGVDLINFALPGRIRSWKWFTPGSLLSVLCLCAMGFVLNAYVNHVGTVARVYGALTSFIVVMLWIYLGNLSLLVGAETDAAVAELKVHGASG